MIVNHDYKNVIDASSGETLGKLFYYLVDETGTIICVVFLDSTESKLYALGTNIKSIGTDIIITKYRKTKPTGLTDYNMIYPDAILLDTEGKEYGNAISLYIEGDNIITLINEHNETFKTSDIVKSEQFYITFDHTPEPEPAPPKPCEVTEASFQYEWILGKTATRSIYARCNTPIIVKGEKVTYSNIISAIMQCALIELIQSVK